MNFEEVKDFLDSKVEQYNGASFIENDPVSIPHRFHAKEDIEIAGFLAATISWGNRKSILQNAEKMLSFMEYTPYDFILHFNVKNLEKIDDGAIHRTFNGCDFKFFLSSLQRIYRSGSNLEKEFTLWQNETDYSHAIERFRKVFCNEDLLHRSKKHLSSPYQNSAAKRLLMYLRWMIRKDAKGVDFGLWKTAKPEFLSLPLDIHSGRVARELGILHRRQNDWKAVMEADKMLRKLDPADPAKYDFALFGLGVSGELNNIK